MADKAPLRRLAEDFFPVLDRLIMLAGLNEAEIKRVEGGVMLIPADMPERYVPVYSRGMAVVSLVLRYHGATPPYPIDDALDDVHRRLEHMREMSE